MEKIENLFDETKLGCMLEISLEHNFFLWMPAKTGTTLAKKVLKNFGFHTYKIINGEIDLTEKYDMHVHTACLFSTHHQYQFIATIRNPYQTFISYFPNKSISKEKIKETLEKKFLGSAVQNKFFSYWERLPDYTISVENPLEDYLKIPFIAESELHKSGELKRIIDSKPNKSPFNYDWKDFYDKKLADLVYYNTSQYFDMFGYDKNSWKK